MSFPSCEKFSGFLEAGLDPENHEGKVGQEDRKRGPLAMAVGQMKVRHKPS
jgi:hypothetical protein